MIAVLIGTRPEFIKLASVLKTLKEKKVPHILIHSGQHYSKELDSQIMEDLKLPQPDYRLDVGSGSHAVQTAKIMIGVEEILLKQKPKVLVVHGDTNTMLGGSLAARKLNISIAHVEAGLRSFHASMAEEINRVITDKISTLLFAPTEGTKRNLINEGVPQKNIFVTGNTIVDALKAYLPVAKKSRILKKLNLEENSYILVTAHRSETIDDSKRLELLIDLLEYASSLIGKKIIWPIHPHTKKRLTESKVRLSKNIRIIPPTTYRDMLLLISKAKLILTDSGGIQEEGYILEKQVITIRNYTERPETLTANFLVDLNKEKFKKSYLTFQKNKVFWQKNVFGKGNAGKLIVKILQNFLSGKLKLDGKFNNLKA